MEVPHEARTKRRVVVVDDGSLWGQGVACWLRQRDELLVEETLLEERALARLEAAHPHAIVAARAVLGGCSLPSLLPFLVANPEVHLIVLDEQTSHVLDFAGRRIPVSGMQGVVDLIAG